MSTFNGAIAYGVVHNPIVDSPYNQQYDVGIVSPPPVGNDFLLLDNSHFLLLEGGNLELL